MSEIKVYNCPHCGGQIEIISINCNMFRHGIYKSNGEQLNPHASKEVCDQVVKDNLIEGCGLPFKILDGKLIKCGYE